MSLHLAGNFRELFSYYFLSLTPNFYDRIICFEHLHRIRFYYSNWNYGIFQNGIYFYFFENDNQADEYGKLVKF